MDNREKNRRSLGLGGVFRGLSDLLQIAVEIAEQGDAQGPSAVEARRQGDVGTPGGLHAVYGVSVRVGAGRAPVVAHFGNVRQNADHVPVIEEEREPLVDVLDEEDHYIVIAEMPGVGPSSVRWELRDDTLLVIRADTESRKYFRKVQLAEPADRETVVSRYENGVLQLKLWKRSRP